MTEVFATRGEHSKAILDAADKIEYVVQLVAKLDPLTLVKVRIAMEIAVNRLEKLTAPTRKAIR